MVAGYRDIVKRIDPELPKLFGRLPRLPYGVKAMGVDRYIAHPGGVTCYKIGELEILELRRYAEKELGAPSTCARSTTGS